MSYKRIYDSDEIVVDLDGQKLRVSVFDDGHWVDEHFVELPEMEPVVHAHWYDDYGGRYANQRWRCSACKGGAFWEFERDELGHEKERQVLSERCPHCGAHMDEEVSE